jgi:hypothetical protein
MVNVLKCPGCGLELNEGEAFAQASERRRMLAELAATIARYRLHNDAVQAAQKS